MKIMHLIGGGDVGGARTHIMFLVRELSKNNDVKLISFRKGEFANAAEEVGIDTEVLHSGILPKDFLCLLNEIDRFQPDVIHCHGSKANMMGALVKTLRKIPTVSTVHSDYRQDYLHSPIKQQTYGRINAISLRRIDFRITVAEQVADLLISRGFDPEKIFTMYNGLDFEDVPKAMERSEYLSSINCSFKADDIIVGIAARLTAVKDVATLIQAFAKAAKKVPQLKLLIAGDGELRTDLEALSRKLGVDDKVYFAGWVSDTASFFEAIDINALTSLSEAFPYSLLEGARARCATVASRVGGIPALIDSGENGFVFEPGDADTLAVCLEKLGTDDRLRQKFADEIYKKAYEDFSLKRMREIQEGIYQTVIRRFKLGKNAKKAVICGAYGRGNAGDDAILKAIVNELRAADSDISLSVLSRDPKSTRLIYRVKSFYIFNIFSLWKHIRKASLFISGGGSLVQDVTSSRSLYFYLFTIALARMLHCRVMMYGCGIGPVNSERNRALAGKLINQKVDVITLRDGNSKTELEKMHVNRPEICLSADPTMNLEPADESLVNAALQVEGIPPTGNYICFALRNWKRFEQTAAFARAAEYAYKTYGLTPVFIAIEYPRDLSAEQKVMSELSCPYFAVRNRQSIEVTIGILAKMKIVMAMRLHALMFSAANGVPVIGVSYDVKVKSFMDYIGASECVALDQVGEAELCRMIDSAWQNRNGASVQNTMNRLRELEKINVETAMKLMKGEKHK